MTSSAASATLISQELFDETILENEECFDLSPDDALRETIDQFCQQLGVPSSSSSSDHNVGTLSPTSIANSDSTAANDAMEVGLPQKPPAALSHLVLSHPNSPEGQRGRSNRNHFQNCLTLLDGCVGTDGKVKNLDATGNDDISSERVLEALAEIGRRCRLGDFNNEEPSRSHDSNDKTNDKYSKQPKNDNIDSQRNSTELPYLAIFQKTSSIYTLMSLLGILDPISMQCSSAAETKNYPTTRQIQIIIATARALSSIISNNSNSSSTTRDTEKCVALRGELRDSFVPALGRLVCLIGGIIAKTNLVSSSQKEEHNGTNAEASYLLTQLCCDLLRLGTNATKGCEVAKVAFVQSALPSELSNALTNNNNYCSGARNRGGVAVILSCLYLETDNASDDASSNSSQLLPTEAACQLLASVCRYDDFRDPSSTAVNTSSAHEHAMEFHRAGGAPILIKIARDVLSKLEDGDGSATNNSCGSASLAENERLAAAVLTALRVLAINDEIVQTMVALGVLPIVTQALQLGATTTAEETEIGGSACNNQGAARSSSGVGGRGGRGVRKQRLATASLGLLRNLCGNDEIKTNLCLGSSSSSSTTPSSSSTPSILPSLLHAMRLYPSAALIQEHACGTLAAMALRRPSNARAILDADGPRWVILAMRRHDANVNIQRQGALSVRNVVSRLLRDLPPGEESSSGAGGSSGTAAESAESERSSVRDAFLELGAEDVLRSIAGRHQGSVDEAYAALRDLGCVVSLVKFNAGDLQKNQTSRSGTMMFGEKHNSNFRPVYEESAGLSEGVDNAVAQFGN